MATFTITIPAGSLANVVAAFSQNWSATLPDGSANPVTQAQYARAQVLALVSQQVAAYLHQQAVIADQGLTIN